MRRRGEKFYEIFSNKIKKANTLAYGGRAEIFFFCIRRWLHDVSCNSFVFFAMAIVPFFIIIFSAPFYY